MISKKCRNFDNITKGLKAAGLIAAGEATDFGTSVILGTAKTLQESTWEKKALIGGVLGNIAASVLDMDLPFVNIGIESMQGIDALIDNGSDIVMGIAGASLAHKAANNIQEINNSNKSIEELIAEMGLDLDDEKQEDITETKVPTNAFTSNETSKMSEEQELMMLQQLLSKHGLKLQNK